MDETQEKHADYELKVMQVIEKLQAAENEAARQNVDQDELASAEFEGTTIQDLIQMVIEELRDHLYVLSERR